MAIELVCPRCQLDCRFPDEWVGRQVKCSHCRQLLSLPTLEQLQHAEDARRGLYRRPRFRVARLAVWALRGLCAACWAAGIGFAVDDVHRHGLAILAAMVAGGWMLFLAESLAIRIREFYRSSSR